MTQSCNALSDQEAFVSVTLNISSLYYYFASNAAYVTFPSGDVNLEVLYPEETAALSMQSVLSAAQRSIYNLVLSGTRSGFSLLLLMGFVLILQLRTSRSSARPLPQPRLLLQLTRTDRQFPHPTHRALDLLQACPLPLLLEVLEAPF